MTFPSNQETTLNDITALLDGAPVINQPALSDKPVAASQPADSTPIASATDFAEVEEKKPFARRVGPKTALSAALVGLTIFPLGALFFGMSNSSSQTAETSDVIELEGEEENTYVTAEEYAAQQAELEELRAEKAFATQQVDIEAIDAAGQQKQAQAAAQAAPNKPSTPTKPASTATARTAAPARTSSPTAVRVRAASPAPRPAARPAQVAALPRQSPAASSTSAPSRPIVQQPPVDPFERRAQLQALGSYGAPPPTNGHPTQAASYTQASNPFDSTDDYYVQTIAFETSAPAPVAPVEQPPSAEDLDYQQDAELVLSAAPPEADLSEAEVTPSSELPEAEVALAPVESKADEPKVIEPIDTKDSAVIDPRRFKSSEKSTEQEATAASRTVIETPVVAASVETPVAAAPMAIMPGTSIGANLPYGFSWQEGAPLPEVLLETTEDIMAGGRAVIPAGTQLLARARIDPGSGVVNLQVVGLFGEARDIQIPRSSIIVHSEDGSVLTANASGGPARTGPNVGGFLMESLGNSLGNVISDNDSLAGDIAGGMAETVIDNQMQRSRANAAVRASRSAAQPVVWTLDSRSLRLTFNNYIPLANLRRS
ncbi:hypothetical protein [Synechococcus sp. PCC 7335]|uniref:hypothetical protein n=1 Tax=Synechococcus sp. (strain ATCC 29403 / PCC 7335) TaxID=91464 RepID=UPI0012FB68F5|nr:hypothetical protein [Synechococcus sp. PCC 7335]